MGFFVMLILRMLYKKMCIRDRSRLCGKDTPQAESGKWEKQAFTDKNNYIASTANEYLSLIHIFFGRSSALKSSMQKRWKRAAKRKKPLKPPQRRRRKPVSYTHLDVYKRQAHCRRTPITRKSVLRREADPRLEKIGRASCRERV